VFGTYFHGALCLGDLTGSTATPVVVLDVHGLLWRLIQTTALRKQLNRETQYREIWRQKTPRPKTPRQKTLGRKTLCRRARPATMCARRPTMGQLSWTRWTAGLSARVRALLTIPWASGLAAARWRLSIVPWTMRAAK